MLSLSRLGTLSAVRGQCDREGPKARRGGGTRWTHLPLMVFCRRPNARRARQSPPSGRDIAPCPPAPEYAAGRGEKINIYTPCTRVFLFPRHIPLPHAS